MADLAAITDIESRWRTLTTDERAKATVRLGDASALLRTLVPGIDARIDADPEGVGRLVVQRVADAVWRSLPGQAAPSGAKSIQETIGGRSYSITYSDAAGGGVVYFTGGELVPLLPGSGQTGPTIGTTYAAARPGWGPPRRRPGDWASLPEGR